MTKRGKVGQPYFDIVASYLKILTLIETAMCAIIEGFNNALNAYRGKVLLANTPANYLSLRARVRQE